MPSNKIVSGNPISDADPLQTQEMGAGAIVAMTAIGATTDAPFVGVETATARTGISLWKGIKNTLYDALGAAADAIVAAGAAGSISAKLRRATQGLEDLKTLVVLAAGGNNIGAVWHAPLGQVAADIHVPAANTAAVVTYAIDATHRHQIGGVVWSYTGGIPVGGSLIVTDAGATIFNIDIADEGVGFIPLASPIIAAAVNTAMVITLAAGGAGITGKLNCLGHRLV